MGGQGLRDTATGQERQESPELEAAGRAVLQSSGGAGPAATLTSDSGFLFVVSGAAPGSSRRALNATGLGGAQHRLAGNQDAVGQDQT